MSNIRNLVFSGTSINSASMAGAARQLANELGGSFQQIECVAGTSAGAILALLIALNCSPQVIEKLYQEFYFIKVADCQRFVYDIRDPVEQNSIYDGDFLRQMISGLIRKTGYADDMTFADLAKKNCKDLHIITSVTCKLDDSSAGQAFIFSAERTPNTRILPVVLAAASTRGLFPPVYMKAMDSGANKYVFAHNGLTLNLAINIFDKKKYDRAQLRAPGNPEDYHFNPQTLGLLLVSQQEPADTSDNAQCINPAPRQHTNTFFKTLLSGSTHGIQNQTFLHIRNSRRTILINNRNISAIDFDNRPEQIKQLILTGARDVQNFFHPQAAAIQQPTPPISHQPALVYSPLRNKIPKKKRLKQSEETWNNSEQIKNVCVIL